MTAFSDTIRLYPGVTTHPARRRVGLLTSSFAAALIGTAVGGARGSADERRPLAARPDRRRPDPVDGGRVVVTPPESVALTRRGRCAGVSVRGGGVGTAHVSAYRGRIDAAAGAAVDVTDASARVVLTDSSVRAASGRLLDARGADVRLVARDQRLVGDVAGDGRSTVAVSLEDGSSLVGAVDRERSARAVTVRLDASSSWTLTGPSHVTRITGLDVDGDTVRNIRGNGRSVRYCRAHNLALRGETLRLTGGGTLRPE